MPKKSIEQVIAEACPRSERQQEFYNCSAKYRLYGGAKGGGKTAALAWTAVEICRRVPGCNVLILRRTTPQLYGGIVRYFQTFVPAETYGGTKNFNLSRNVVTFPNGSKIFFRPCEGDDDIYSFQGGEYVAILIDESTEFSYEMFRFLQAQNRCPFKKDVYGRPVVPFMALATNPVGIGRKWHKQLFVDKVPCDEMDDDQKALYDPKKFAFIPAFVQDNPAYKNDTDYLAVLNAMSKAEKAAYLYGSWDVASGSFFERYDRDAISINKAFALRVVHTQYWQPKWISIDWGFEHYTCVHFWSRADWPLADGSTSSKIIMYREFVTQHTDSAELGAAIANECKYRDGSGKEKMEKIEAIYLSPDAFAKRDSGNTPAERMGEVLSAAGLPLPGQADDDRVSGWRLMDEMISAPVDESGNKLLPDVLIADDCEETLSAIPLLMRSDKNIEDVKKTKYKADDVADCFRYGLKSFLSEGRVPFAVERARALAECKTNQQKFFTDIALQQKKRSKGLGIRFTKPRDFIGRQHW